MDTEGFKRKLTAILSTDVEGYSRLMGEDEEATVRTLTTYREMMAKVIQKHEGRVVDSPGDNVLAEFASVVAAVRCAVEVQEELRVQNAELPENRRMQFRIGINLGDVIQEGERIYGDGVNIAARIEGLADGGGICISRTVYDQVKNKLSLGYKYMGEHTVKNIAEPVRVYRVLMEPDIGIPKITKAFKFPDKPSIAVLPFLNMSGDPEQEYFSDGITEEIITGLSNIRHLFVIARNSTFTYKEKPVKVQQVAEELGISYVLEGSVRKAGNRIRITAQLVDAITGHHLWAERYDRDLKDIFAIQDEITMKIVTALQVELTEGEQARLYGKGTENLEAYTKFLRAQKYFYKGDFSLSRQMAKEAVELDENYPAPYVLLAWTHWFEARLGWGESSAESLKQAYSTSQKALTMDDTIPLVHAIIGGIHLYQRQHELAIAEGARAVALGPNNADVHAMMGHILRFAGSFEEAIDMTKKAVRLHPNYPSFYLMELAMCHYYLGKYEEAVAFAEQFRTLAQSRGEDNILWSSHLILAINYIRLGREKEARAAATEVLRLFPSFSLEWDRLYSCYKDPAHLERQHEDLRKAGLK
ncbi:MAG: tetratricopeptide repeat protein [Proteobacteria bacterium]|nr:tetratricopeptide repeat protein [Pseudomonadota bacterium]